MQLRNSRIMLLAQSSWCHATYELLPYHRACLQQTRQNIYLTAHTSVSPVSHLHTHRPIWECTPSEFNEPSPPSPRGAIPSTTALRAASVSPPVQTLFSPLSLFYTLIDTPTHLHVRTTDTYTHSLTPYIHRKKGSYRTNKPLYSHLYRIIFYAMQCYIYHTQSPYLKSVRQPFTAVIAVDRQRQRPVYTPFHLTSPLFHRPCAHKAAHTTKSHQKPPTPLR
jgi:hypothetical protein